MKEEKKKGENLKYCLRYKCKNCPRWKQCEKDRSVREGGRKEK